MQPPVRAIVGLRDPFKQPYELRLRLYDAEEENAPQPSYPGAWFDLVAASCEIPEEVIYQR